MLAVLAAAAPAVADEAGDDIAHPAGPLTGNVNFDGVLDTNTDRDWWVLYTTPQKPLNIAVTGLGGGLCGGVYASLRDADGKLVSSQYAYNNQTDNFNFTTPVAPARYYVSVSNDGCNGNRYRLFVNTPEALTSSAPGPQPAEPTAFEREPNESIGQPFGPLLGATTYGGSFNSNTDVDWWTFYLNPSQPVDIAVTGLGGSTCGGVYVSLRDEDGEQEESEYASTNETEHFNFTTPALSARYHLVVSNEGCNGTRYLLRIDPAGAVTQAAPPPDGDKDDVADAADSCPTQAGIAPSGCPDTDRDGLTDNADACPRDSGGAALRGCPDADGDGITDNADQCRSTRGTAPTGCPDSDRDGVIDTTDECDRVPGPGPRGCPPPDRDGDGIVDAADRCPAVRGTMANGCPVLVRHRTTVTLRRRGSRYLGRLRAGTSACLRSRRVVLRVVGRGTRSFGTDTTSRNGAFDIALRRRPRGRVYVVVVARTAGSAVCQRGRSAIRRA